MPRFYFNLHDGSALTDEEGVDLPDMQAARHMAAEFFGTAIKDAGAAFFDGHDWRLDVTDERGLILFTTTAFAFNAAMISPRVARR